MTPHCTKRLGEAKSFHFRLGVGGHVTRHVLFKSATSPASKTLLPGVNKGWFGIPSRGRGCDRRTPIRPSWIAPSWNCWHQTLYGLHLETQSQPETNGWNSPIPGLVLEQLVGVDWVCKWPGRSVPSVSSRSLWLIRAAISI